MTLTLTQSIEGPKQLGSHYCCLEQGILILIVDYNIPKARL